MQPGETMELIRHARTAGLAEDKLGGRVLVGAGAHGPTAVVEVEDRDEAGDVHVGFVVGVQRAYVTPVERLLLVLIDKVVGLHAVATKQLGQDVVTEVVLGIRVFGVAHQFGQQDVGIEEVDAHGGVDHLRIEGRNAGRSSSVFQRSRSPPRSSRYRRCQTRRLLLA